MSNLFNVDEVFEMAQHMERVGAEYYRDAATQFSAHPQAQILTKLAAMEDGHFQQFGAIREQMKRAVPLPESWDPDRMAAQYLDALSAHKVFRPQESPAQRFTGSETLRDILQKAIGMEKDSIVYYAGIKELVPPHLGRAQVDEIIRQEMGHVTTLTKELAEIK